MRAVTYRDYGSPSSLSVREIARPLLGESDVLVRVHAASVNSWDRDNLTGALANRGQLGLRRPRIRVLGGDIAGQVEAVGHAVKRWKPGDEVLGDLSAAGWGAFAELACAPEHTLTRKPVQLSFPDAAAMPQAAVIALQGIRDYCAVRAGQKVLINGAGGGAGSFAIQLAKLQGAEVTGVDSAPKLGMMRELGADHVIDYRAADYTLSDERYDAILDFELHRSPRHYRRVLAPEGRVTVVGGHLTRILHAVMLGRWLALRRGQRIDLLMHRPNRNLAELAELAAQGRLKCSVERIYPLAELPLAMQRMCDGEVLGKAVIDLMRD
jgi:NADPH:quinone reductase-like Zn-dependent oxidoreductase